MENSQLASSFSDLSTPLVADACVRLHLALHVAPAGIKPLMPKMCVAGRVLPARHRGSVDVFLEALRSALPGDVLVIDNSGRSDEACIGDLTVLEARGRGVSGVIVRGYHRDTQELVAIGLPVFSYGSFPAGPIRLDPRGPEDLISANWGGFLVDSKDVVFADDDGVLFVPMARAEEVLEVARSIWKIERKQAEAIRGGKLLSQQVDFEAYLTKRDADPSYTFRRHLREKGGAVEE